MMADNLADVRMRQFIAAFLVFLTFVMSGTAHADFNGSKAWFEALPAEDRSATQANLTLLGFYEYLIDGQFGNGTYKALVAFQKDEGLEPSGVLSALAADRLDERAAAVYLNLGMDLVRDQAGQAALIIPVALLTITTPTERGNAYATPDGGISLETLRTPIGEQPFQLLFQELKKAGNGRFITYSNFNDQRFVVSGKQGDRSFYTMFQSAQTDSVGYSLSWTAENEDQAKMLAIFIASHFSALRNMPPEDDDVKLAETPSLSQQFGGFSLPVGAPDVIMLNGEVTPTLADEFERALEVRPNARILVLNSPGGYVDSALRVAREAHKRGMSTLVARGMGCYSACAYIFFAGSPRDVEGELGVHQISSEVADLVLAQTTLSDVLDALDLFGVEQMIISVMLRTPPEDMHVFSAEEIADYSINVGGPVLLADVSHLTEDSNGGAAVVPVEVVDTAVVDADGQAFVELALQSSEEAAQRSLEYAVQRWSGIIGDAIPVIDREDKNGATVFRVRLPARSAESANALCSAIRSAGGGCFVSSS
jgi:peptidoglycan hydrolase-like protein with peptidoglycan-binding domain